jgi:bifunctional DNase/RNase
MKKVQVEVLGLSQSPTSNGSYALILKEIDGDRRLPIVIGAPEAGAIAYELEGVHTSRPMSHDLMKTLIETFESKVLEICIHELKDSTFFAAITLENTTVEVDSRPSDAIALALRFDAPIFIVESLLQEAGFSLDELDTTDEDDIEEIETFDISDDEEEDEEFFLPNKKSKKEKAHTSKTNKKDQLHDELQAAIQEEDYEKAAKIRDELEKLL